MDSYELEQYYVNSSRFCKRNEQLVSKYLVSLETPKPVQKPKTQFEKWVMASLKKLDAEEAELSQGERPSNAVKVVESKPETSAENYEIPNSDYETPVVEAEKLIGDIIVIMTHNESFKIKSH